MHEQLRALPKIMSCRVLYIVAGNYMWVWFMLWFRECICLFGRMVVANMHAMAYMSLRRGTRGGPEHPCHVQRHSRLEVANWYFTDFPKNDAKPGETYHLQIE